MNKIGTGGMGAVYLAEHPQIGKKVALKVIHRELASNREVVQRFFQEAKAVNKIGNEHIVEIHDFGVTPEGDHYYIMEYLEGSNLATTLGHESVLDVRRALHIGAQIASALAAAHAAGVIHRDLKPDNVMLTTRLGDPDFVKLLDFGLAKMFAGSPSAVKTAAGVLLGTPQYMSPEACESRVTLDHRTDIYALGVLLFQMITGVLPFDGETMGEVLVKQVTQLPPPPRQYNPNIPPSVEQILLRCLMKQPDARFPTMVALREALLDPEGYLHRSPPMAPARSLAPGEIKVDAKTVMAYAAQQAKTRIGIAGELPLVSPPSLSGGSAQQATMISDGTLVPPRQTHGPDMAVPGMLKTNTMRIATPLGYSSRPPRRVWPIVLIVALLLGLGGGGFAVAWFGRSEAPVVAAAADAAAPPPPPADAAVRHAATAPVDAPRAVPADAAAIATAAPPDAAIRVTPVAMATVEIDTAPSGADVVGPDNQVLGKTPAKLTLPITTTPLTVVLRLAGYQKKSKQLVVTGNLVLEVPLDRTPQGTVIHRGQGSGSGKRGSSDDLERP
ncbi:MAG TPA: serine/threonine-protein kinase [Kofleriaceae bacterium]|nr:serine/threonine-protein kinase [Kofleriaceae bacterium]